MINVSYNIANGINTGHLQNSEILSLVPILQFGIVYLLQELEKRDPLLKNVLTFLLLIFYAFNVYL